MATINLGAIKFNWKGAYNSGTSYAVDDVVSSGGNSYVCIQAHSNQAVGNATAYWNIMATKGTNGSAGAEGGTTTLTTRGDILYRGASTVERLPKGTAGYVLKQGANDPEWGTAGGGAMTFVTRTAITSNANNVSFTNLEANNYHHFIFQGIDSTANGGEDWCFQFSSDNGSNWLGTSYYSSAWQTYSAGSTNNLVQHNGSYVSIADGFHNSGSDEGLHGEITISNIGNGQRGAGWWQTAHKANSSTTFRSTNGGAMMMNGETINAIKFFFDSGSITGSSYAFITHYKGVIA